MERTLSHSEAREFYDRFGARQDRQGFYEDAALDDLAAHGRFEEAKAVFEFGCGTGRFARRLLSRSLPPACSYLGVDISSTMISLAQERLKDWPDRAAVMRTEGSVLLDAGDGRFDRFVSTYVIDLLSEAEIGGLIGEARRILIPGGALCLVSLTEGRGPLKGLLTRLWRTVHRINPRWVGGCRPVRLLDYLGDSQWKILHRGVISSWGICSEVLVAERL